MKSIHYAGDVLLTSDAIADAVILYAAALGRSDTSVELKIPVMVAGGMRSEATMVLGPASQLLAEPDLNPSGQFDDSDVVASIEQRTAALGPVKVEPSDDYTRVNTD